MLTWLNWNCWHNTTMLEVQTHALWTQQCPWPWTWRPFFHSCHVLHLSVLQLSVLQLHQACMVKLLYVWNKTCTYQHHSNTDWPVLQWGSLLLNLQHSHTNLHVHNHKPVINWTGYCWIMNCNWTGYCWTGHKTVINWTGYCWTTFMIGCTGKA